MKKISVLSIALLVLALIVLPVVTGCGGTTTTTTAAPASSTTTAAAGAAYDINKIVAGVQPDPSILSTLPDKYKNAAIKVGSDIPYPPWEMFVGETDQVTGFDYDLGQALAAKMGIPGFQFIKASFDSILIGIESGKYDIGMSAFTDNKSRQAKFDMIDYAQDGTGILVVKGNPKGITGIESLAGTTVGTEKGTTQAASVAAINDLFKSQSKQAITANEYPDQPANLLALQSGKVDAIVTDASTAGSIAASNPDKFQLVLDPNPPSGWEDQPDAIAVLKGNDALRDAIMKALQGLFDDGTYKTIIDHYGIVPIDKPGLNLGTQTGSL